MAALPIGSLFQSLGFLISLGHSVQVIYNHNLKSKLKVKIFHIFLAAKGAKKILENGGVSEGTKKPNLYFVKVSACVKVLN